MRRIIPHNSAQSQLNLRPHNSPQNWTKLTRDAAYFGEMETRHYNIWLFSEVATRCLHQITSDTAITDRKRAKFAQNFQFSIRLHDCYSRVRKLTLIPMSPKDCLLEIN